MVKITLSTKELLSQVSDCYAYAVEKNFNQSQLKDIIKLYPDVPGILKRYKFSGNFLESIAIPFSFNNRIVYCIIVGLGDDSYRPVDPVERYRRVLGQMVKEVRACKGNSIALNLPSARLLKTTVENIAQQVAIIFKMADYHFGDYISDKDRKGADLESVIIAVDEKNKKEAQKGITEGSIIGDGVNQTRHWIDLPPSALTPKELAKKAEIIAKKNDLAVTVFGEAQIIKMGMGGLASVSRGSQEDCALIILEYKAKKKNAPTLCFVGKGITFDSGGLSIKPAESMETMKQDMSGAAAVISAIDILAQLKPAINIIAIAPTSENLPSGHATKPGDIIRFYNGKTAEVKNTDAEGRLILADALSYAVKHYKPDAIIDLATLTGACGRALGPFYSGLFSQHSDLIDRLQKAGHLSGDLLWSLPMGDDYKKAIISTVADICNIGSKQVMAGSTTAAHFLQHFVDDIPWAHIDIAGTAFDVPNISYFRPGATGVGVRLLVALAMNWK